MLKYFICPDHQRVEVKQCLKSCRMQHRCLTLKTLKEIADERTWTGKPSVTQLFNGPRMNKWVIEKDWEENPRRSGFKILGQRVSNKLDNMENRMEHRGVTGLPDHLEHEDGVLTDYKTSGSYKVRKALGLVAEKRDHPTEVYRSSGAWGKKGTPKQVTIWVPKDEPDYFEWMMQLNKYRQMLEKEGFKINKLQIQVIIRDGNTIAAEQNGIPRDGDNIQLIPIPIVPDDEMDAYFDKRRDELIEAMSDLPTDSDLDPASDGSTLRRSRIPRMCDDSETWGGTRCRYYCPVKEYCRQVGDNPYLK